MSKFDRTREPEPGAIRGYDFPTIESRRLNNGLQTLVARHGDLPVVTVRIVVDAGAGAEVAGEQGLATLTANALEGGTSRLDGSGLAWELERLGVQLDTWVTWDALHVGCTAVRDQLPAVLALLAEVVRTPAFPAGEVERLREEQLAELLQRRVEPRALADDMAAQFIFPDSNPYARPLLGRRESVTALDPAAVARFHASHFAPRHTAVVMTGAISAEEAHRLVERSFGGWQAKPAAGAVPAAAAPATGAVIHLVDRPGAVQSELRLGHVGLARDHQDYYPVLVMNAVLGGTFTSRLNLSLRERHGFTYGVRSAFAFRRHPGPFVIQTAVGTDVTVRAAREALNEIDALLEQGPTEQEVATARRFLAGVFPLQLQTTDQLAARLAELVTYDLPADYFAHYRDRITAVTRDDVLRAARAHVRPRELAIVVVGDAASLHQELADLDLAPVERHTINGHAA
ncbi:MAG TPA: pitrilysin family protein [Longimicrobiales bacterium]|nr:pitrilysin family protein [Longimicrobiales bacterium]